jgi:hypothetical protein
MNADPGIRAPHTSTVDDTGMLWANDAVFKSPFSKKIGYFDSKQG